MITRVLAIYLLAFLLGGIGLYAASRKQSRQIRHERLIKFVTYFGIVNTLLVAALAGRWAFSISVALVAVFGAWELSRVLFYTAGGSWLRAIAIAVLYALIAVAAVCFAWLSLAQTAIFFCLIVCAFDGFSQVTGQLFGRHALAPQISPKKTVEGSLGGFLFAIGLALLLRPLLGTGALQALAVSCFIVAAALTGDMLASLVKRRSHIKDFSNLIPGHGGILDRFDSFLFAAAACLAIGMIENWLARMFQ